MSGRAIEKPHRCATVSDRGVMCCRSGRLSILEARRRWPARRLHMSEDKPFWTPYELQRDGVGLEAAIQPAVNLALAHNDVPLVRSVRVTNASTMPLEDVTLRLTLDGRGASLAPEWTAKLAEPIPPGEHRLWDALEAFAPSYEHLANLDESHRATAGVTVTHAWGPDVALSAPVQVLAHNEWFSAPLFYESLAAFVQPNTRAVATILDAAAELLRVHTGDASMGGYQQGPERASKIAAAVYEALRSQGIRYVDPPASFEDSGQKVRTTGQVLDQRLGTCVDLAVAYAACLEQAGLHPLLWLIDGHALAGYLRESGTLGQTVITEPNTMVNLVESGRAVPVEAAYYETGDQGTFAAAVATGHRRLRDPETLLGILDVHTAHRAGTRPLPSNDITTASEATNAPRAPGNAAASVLDLPSELLARPEEEDVLLNVADDAPARVRQWKRALLDLSTRNRLLNLKASAEVLDLHVPTGTLALLDDIVHDGKPIKLVPQDELSDLQRLQGARRAQDLDADLVRKFLVDDHAVFAGVGAQGYVTRMRKLQRTARTMLEETGNANLYLTVGALVHRTPTGKEARAPLFLLPVKIEGGTGRSAFQIRVDTTSVASPNHCLVEWLRIKHNVQIEALETPRLDRSGIDIVAALPAIRDALVTHRLDVRIDEVASVGICQFSTFGMWRDLERSWDVLSQSPVVEHLALRPGESFLDPAAPGEDQALEALHIDEAEMPLPIPADGSQLRAVALGAAGRSFVLEGPPGTGKSQTITNLVAHALANGRTVLFVAEKQAALDVVKRRLTDVGLSDFTLDLHGRSQRPAEIRAQLKRAVDNIAVYDRRGWEAICATLRARHAPLEEYPDRIHGPNAIGVTLWGAAENLEQYGEGPVAPIPAIYVARQDTDEGPIKDAVRNFARAARTVGLRPRHPWAVVGALAEDLDPAALAEAASALEAAMHAARGHRAAWNVLEGLGAASDLDALLPHLDDRAAAPVPDAPRLAQLRSASWIAARDQLVEEVGGFAGQHHAALSTFARSFLEHGETAALAAAAEAAKRGLFGKRKRSEEFEQTVRPLLADGTSVQPVEVPGLLIGIEAARSHASQLVAQQADLLGDAAQRSWTPLRPDAGPGLTDVLERLERTEAFERRHGALWLLLEGSGPLAPDAAAGLRDVAAAWQHWQALLGCSAPEIERWTGERHWTAAWSEDSEIWTREIADSADAPARRWSRMVELLDPLAAAGLDEFRDALLSARLDAAEAEVAYLRGVAVASLRERRAASGLQGFDAALRDGEIADFANAAEAARSEQKVALPAELLERRAYRGDRLTGKVGELRRRLDAKRGGLTFRQLIERYGEEILQATPCFFVSPASLAQYVPPGSVTFDLVVFDEASQVTVAQAVGALGRGRSAIIVGDSQQMPPTSVGKVKAMDGGGAGDDDDEPEVLEDLESILTECVESGLPRVWLSWHYRSQDETLIAFSNAYYYEGRLASLPSPGGDPQAGVELRRVQGHFNREDSKHEFRTNRVEAEAIVAEIRRSLADPHRAEQSVGVVTFNAQQRDLVLNLLEECGDPLVARQLREDAREGIFVKNLENVQGDERDIILFSVAFSKRPDGGPLPMNFGPLGTSGGEKRLNVAITRARRKVILFASFDPSDIDLTRTSSKGIAHLRSYLELAANGPEGLAATTARTVVGTDHVREAIATALRARGYEVASDYGLSGFSLDLVVRERTAERWQVAIVLDGPRWAERPTVADRDLTPLLLQRMMRWGASLRVWLPEWLDDQEAVLRRVDQAIAQAREEEECEHARREAQVVEQQRAIEAAAADDGGEDPEDEADAELVESGEDAVELETFTYAPEPSMTATPETPQVLVASQAMVEPSAAPTDRAPYAEVEPTQLGTREDLGRTSSPDVRRIIADAVRETVDAEGPIATARLARSIGRRFGFDRVAAARQRFILEALPTERVRSSELGEFAWPADLDPDAWRGYRTTPEEIDRPLSDLAPEEIINAMADVSAHGQVTNEEELFRATLALFGQRRLTGQTTARLQSCLAVAQDASRLVRGDDGWRAGA
ncbi:DUF4011 domain-containing protein [Baekduia sp.]|uniref:DUF4011 domain-containing protein n=1 Tax=Baekduia sp. TaxID=2600305 RepID=UPI0039C894E4